MPARYKVDLANGLRDPLQGDDRQIEVKVDPLLMIEGDLLAVAGRAVFDGRLPFAMPVRITAAVRLSEHEVLLARDAAAPN